MKKIHTDVTSLYPYINKYCRYPIGTLKILLSDDLSNRNVFNIDFQFLTDTKYSWPLIDRAFKMAGNSAYHSTQNFKDKIK